jgi:hypothetical protein
MLTDRKTRQLFNDKLIFIYQKMTRCNKLVAYPGARFYRRHYVFSGLHQPGSVPDMRRNYIFNKRCGLAAPAGANPEQAREK